MGALGSAQDTALVKRAVGGGGMLGQTAHSHPQRLAPN